MVIISLYLTTHWMEVFPNPHHHLHEIDQPPPVLCWRKLTTKGNVKTLYDVISVID